MATLYNLDGASKLSRFFRFLMFSVVSIIEEYKSKCFSVQLEIFNI